MYLISLAADDSFILRPSVSAIGRQEYPFRTNIIIDFLIYKKNM